MYWASFLFLVMYIEDIYIYKYKYIYIYVATIHVQSSAEHNHKTWDICSFESFIPRIESVWTVYTVRSRDQLLWRFSINLFTYFMIGVSSLGYFLWSKEHLDSCHLNKPIWRWVTFFLQICCGFKGILLFLFGRIVVSSGYRAFIFSLVSL